VTQDNSMKILKWMQRTAAAGLRGLAAWIEGIGGPGRPPPK
jgi:hypothetical protein